MPGSPTPVEVFYSYAHQDEPLRVELENHLSLLRRQGVITAWHDRHIVPGTDWAQALNEHLERASIILLLVSSDFLASDYCYGIEMAHALEREQAKQARIIPILLRPVDWQGAPFAHLEALPTNSKAITAWDNRDAAFADVAAGIRRAIEALSLPQASVTLVSFPSIWNNREAQMNNSIPKHVFVAYAKKDGSFVKQLTADLQNAGIKIWIDYYNLKPGTPNREVATRKAIAEAFAVILVASPNAMESDYVQSELHIAKEHERFILPVWAYGKNWAECASIEMVSAQYIDLRRKKYISEILEVIQNIKNVIEAQSPKHSVIEEGYTPPGYITIHSDNGIIAMRHCSYQTINALLHDLYVTYLYHSFPPYTYGSKWILASRDHFELQLLVLPWEWFLLTESQRHEQLRKYYPNWGEVPLETCGIYSDTKWRVLKGIPQAVFAIAAQDDRLYRTISSFGRHGEFSKHVLSMVHEEEWHTSDEVDPQYHKLIFSSTRSSYGYGRRDYPKPIPTNKVLIPNWKPWY